MQPSARNTLLRYGISGGSGTEVEEPPVETPPIETPPVETPPAPPDETARLREEVARLRGQVEVLSSRPAPAAQPEPPQPPVDPIQAEYSEVEKAFAEGRITEPERQFRLGQLGARAEFQRQAREAKDAEAREREAQAVGRSKQTIGAYMQRHPGLSDPQSADMAKVWPHLTAVTEEFGWDKADPRAQALALERAFGPLTRGTAVDPREFERRRIPAGGGGGGSYTEDPPNPKPKSRGQDLFDRLLPEYQQFYVQTRGSKEAAYKTLEHADEHQMRRQGRFR